MMFQRSTVAALSLIASCSAVRANSSLAGTSKASSEDEASSLNPFIPLKINKATNPRHSNNPLKNGVSDEDYSYGASRNEDTTSSQDLGILADNHGYSTGITNQEYESGASLGANSDALDSSRELQQVPDECGCTTRSFIPPEKFSRDLVYQCVYGSCPYDPNFCWNTSEVTDMSYAFNTIEQFDSPIGCWDVGKVTNMKRMFSTTYFYQPLDSWDVGNVTNMAEMFWFANLNQPLDSWNVGKVTNMESMFFHAIHFNQPLDSWDVGKVTNMEFMFQRTYSFNQPLASWNVGNVTNMGYMFEGGMDANFYTIFNQPLESWDVGKVTSMRRMFSGAKPFNQPLDSWNVGNVTDMNEMFENTFRFNQCLGTWAGKTPYIVSTSGMFNGTSCPDEDTDPNVGPWCQSDDICIADTDPSEDDFYYSVDDSFEDGAFSAASVPFVTALAMLSSARLFS